MRLSSGYIGRACMGLMLLTLMTGGSLFAALAFPGAEGYGRIATGGRGGVVYEVTNLNDSGSGSLRAAVAASGPRTVVFRVSGTIYLNSDLRISNDHITIAGQTAPGDGICLANYSLLISADNVIVRFLRVRVGDQGSATGADGRDAMFCRYTDRVILDHCSFSWSIDETASAYFNTNFTMQWCLISESLRYSLHSKEAHGYGGIWGGQGVSFHHNLLAHHTSRNPRLNGSRNMPAVQSGISFTLEEADLRNNLIYNWSSNSCYGGEPRDDGMPSRYNFVGNYYKAGPATPSSSNDRIVNPTAVNGVYSQFFLSGNTTTASQTTSANNWLGVDGPSSAAKEVMRLNAAAPAGPLTEQMSLDAYQQILQSVGACLPVRDSHDTRIVQEVEAGTFTYGAKGIIDSQSEVGGWPVLTSLPAPVDTDRDGMPDSWESHRGLNPNNSADRNGDPDGDGYTHLEDYLNGLVNHVYPQPALQVESAAGQLQVVWENQLNDKQLLVSSTLSDWAAASLDAQGSYGRFDVVTNAGTSSFYRLGAANKPPFIEVVSPPAGTEIMEGQVVSLSVIASDSDGSVSAVEFFINGLSVGVDETAPYAVLWTAQGDGPHDYTVVVTDNEGATSESTPGTIWVLGSTSTEGTTYHAELADDGTWDLFEQTNDGFHGSGYVNFINYSYIDFINVEGGNGGPATLIFRFALGVASAREGLLTVNETSVPLVFQPTGAWTIWNELTVDVTLNPGATNMIRVVALANDLANLDEMIVISATVD